MTFLNIPQIELLKDKLKSFVRQVAKTVRKPVEDLYYAYEPATKTIHIVNGAENFALILGKMAESKRKLRKFPNGKYFRVIPRRVVEFGLIVNPDEYRFTQCWNTNKELSVSASFNKGRIYFRLGKGTGQVTDEPVEIDIPDIKEGRRFRTREQQVVAIFSDVNLESMLDSLGIPIGVQLRKDIKHKFKEAGRTLLPDPRALA